MRRGDVAADQISGGRECDDGDSKGETLGGAVVILEVQFTVWRSIMQFSAAQVWAG